MIYSQQNISGIIIDVDSFGKSGEPDSIIEAPDGSFTIEYSKLLINVELR